MICDLVPHGVVRTYAVVAHPEDATKTCIVMELMHHTMHDERTHPDHIQDGPNYPAFDPALALSRTLGHFAQVAEALHAIHEIAGVVVLDIKPKNILIDKFGNALIADFGVSHAVRKIESTIAASVRDVSVGAGTPPYFSPEQRGIKDRKTKKIVKASFASDIWNVGASLLEMFSGDAPWIRV